jgi:hypothetical protein
MSEQTIAYLNSIAFHKDTQRLCVKMFNKMHKHGRYYVNKTVDIYYNKKQTHLREPQMDLPPRGDKAPYYSN